MTKSPTELRLQRHVARLRQCRRCPRMVPPPVSGGAVVSDVMLVGQAPGVREPVAGKPFAWTAGKTLFRWFEESAGLTEEMVRARSTSPLSVAVSRKSAGRKRSRAQSARDRKLLIMAGSRDRYPATTAGHSGRQIGDRAIHSGREIRRYHWPDLPCRACRPALRYHSTAAPFRRISLASDPTWTRAVAGGAKVDRSASGVSETPAESGSRGNQEKKSAAEIPGFLASRSSVKILAFLFPHSSLPDG